MVEVGKSYKANRNVTKGMLSMPWSNCILTVDKIHGDPENPNTRITFTANNWEKNSCRVNWLKGYWLETTT